MEGNSLIEMLSYAEQRVSSRKQRLFVCACCRYAWEFFGDARSRSAVQLAEDFADARSSLAEVIDAHHRVEEAVYHSHEETEDFVERAASYAAWVASSEPFFGCVGQREAAIGIGNVMANRAAFISSRDTRAVTAWKYPSPGFACSLLRHVAGNPYRRPPALQSSSAAVVRLAQAAYEQQRVQFALHDALLDAGHADLAAHFRDPAEWHPKGCWALDLILGKS
jgi:hypothetical protein